MSKNESKKPATSTTQTGTTDTTMEGKARKKLGPVDHVAEALLRLQQRLRIAERGVYGDQRAAVNELRKEVLTLFVKADGVRPSSTPRARPTGKVH